MSRSPQIEDLGLESRVHELFANSGSYTTVAQALAAEGYPITMRQVQNFLTSEERSSTSHPPVRRRDTGAAEEQNMRSIPDAMDPPATQKSTIVPISQLVGAYQGAPSIFDVGVVLQANYVYLQDLIANSDNHKQALSTVAEIRAHAELAARLLDKIATYQEVTAFQNEVIQAIGDADAETQGRILDSLRRRRALRLTTSVSKLTG